MPMKQRKPRRGDRRTLTEREIRRYVNRIVDAAMERLQREQVYVAETHVREYTVRAHVRRK